MARIVGLKIAEPSSLPASRLSGMKTQHSMPRRAACADDAVGEVAGRRARQHLEAELHGARRGDRDDAVLVRQRRMVHRVVLDVQLADAEPLGQAVAAHERREAGVETGARLAGDRQQLAVAPEVLRPLLDLLRASGGSARSRRPARAARGTCRRRRSLRPETASCTDDTAVQSARSHSLR